MRCTEQSGKSVLCRTTEIKVKDTRRNVHGAARGKCEDAERKEAVLTARSGVEQRRERNRVKTCCAEQHGTKTKRGATARKSAVQNSQERMHRAKKILQRGTCKECRRKAVTQDLERQQTVHAAKIPEKLRKSEMKERQAPVLSEDRRLTHQWKCC